jgi:ElaB/YqjD/DUF883 family membrane-anchored ribosome-binding protein
MVDYNADKASSEIKSLVADAQDLFNAATSASADKAAALRSEGMRVLEMPCRPPVTCRTPR